jgi:hypothetical protein
LGGEGNLSWVIKNGRWEAIFWGSRVSLRGLMGFNTEKSSSLEKRYRTAAGLSHLFFSCPTQVGREGVLHQSGQRHAVQMRIFLLFVFTS